MSSTTHNYDAGSIWIDGETWTVIAPTGARSELRDTQPERFWGQGGELERWVSTDQGKTWELDRKITENSPRNQGFVRRTLRGTGRFQSFWSDGNPDGRTEVHLYFGDSEGKRLWELPYEMAGEVAKPVEIDPPYERWLRDSFDGADLADPSKTGKNEDPDGDGFSNFREYVSATDPDSLADRPDLSQFTGKQYEGRHVLTYGVNPEAYDVTTFVEASEDLSDWEDAEDDFSLVSRYISGGLEIFEKRDETSFSPQRPVRFYRLNQSFDR